MVIKHGSSQRCAHSHSPTLYFHGHSFFLLLFLRGCQTLLRKGPSWCPLESATQSLRNLPQLSFFSLLYTQPLPLSSSFFLCLENLTNRKNNACCVQVLKLHSFPLSFYPDFMKKKNDHHALSLKSNISRKHNTVIILAKVQGTHQPAPDTSWALVH